MATEPHRASPTLLRPQWPAPAAVNAVLSTRLGGVSAPPFDSLNLGAHVGDDPRAVAENRRRLIETAGLPMPQWLRQVHACRVVRLPNAAGMLEADACYTTQRGVACAVLVADCLPVLLCDDAAGVVAAAHAGWRGLAAGVLEATVAALPVLPDTLIAWMGPAIGPADFEVGEEVRKMFVERDADCAGAFRPGRPGKYQADLHALARIRLRAAGVSRVYGAEGSTRSEPQRFYSFRRDGTTGRFAAIIALR
ncbi:peptidoglycan editing factor PgeF [Algiphilus sp. W345]|uniref:Purine nucleoside phosphorylase n=1 Tax=Banduia mediterranea TaxID=3075609 RepID=A0ABU2WGV2_9GAMM|nr:peptidoglycan editing factor PgeF [Algiphilus sp. W345]MDT0496753.1 peptidoglycan editing factor PgeF [Algiphilus sp. W345]